MSLLADLRTWRIVVLVSMLGVGSAQVPYGIGKRGLPALLVPFPEAGTLLRNSTLLLLIAQGLVVLGAR